MSLILQIVSTHPTAQTMLYEFKQQSGSIGRSQRNNWVLPDEQKYLSGQHALIEYHDNVYTLTDTSTNGVFLNRANQALGKGCSVNLNDGDLLRMGVYDIRVNIPNDSNFNRNNDANNTLSNDFFSFDELFSKDAIMNKKVTSNDASQNWDVDWFTDMESKQDDPSEQYVKANQQESSISKITPEMEIKTESKTLHIAKQQFLAGLQLDDKDIEKKVLENLDFQNIGELFRISIQGTLDILHSRTHIKNEMRMDITTIQAIENNPLKFSITVEEALAHLFIPKSSCYLPPKQSLEEAYDDIRAHQLAVISGIQATLSYMLQRFEPKKLSNRLEKKIPITANIPLYRQAKLWSLFETLYETIQEETEGDFNSLFALEFSKAYEQQIASLKK